MGQENKRGQRQGEGTLVFKNGEAKFVGKFEKGNMIEGKITYLQTGEECWFDGTFKDNKWDTGTLRKGQATYTGTFVNQ